MSTMVFQLLITGIAYGIIQIHFNDHTAAENIGAQGDQFIMAEVQQT